MLSNALAPPSKGHPCKEGIYLPAQGWGPGGQGPHPRPHFCCHPDRSTMCTSRAHTLLPKGSFYGLLSHSDIFYPTQTRGDLLYCLESFTLIQVSWPIQNLKGRLIFQTFQSKAWQTAGSGCRIWGGWTFWLAVKRGERMTPPFRAPSRKEKNFQTWIYSDNIRNEDCALGATYFWVSKKLNAIIIWPRLTGALSTGVREQTAINWNSPNV